jgi:universal stress protein A
MRIKPTTKPGRVLMELNRADDPLLAESARGGASALFRLQRILVPTDFSDCSKKALRYAIAFARQFQAELILLHVVPAGSPVGADFGLYEAPILEADLRAGGQQELAALCQREIRGEVLATPLVRTGRAAPEIVAAAKDSQIDLIILATHGRTGLQHVLLGSTTEEVVRHAPCPVLTVREQEHEFV